MSKPLTMLTILAAAVMFASSMACAARGPAITDPEVAQKQEDFSIQGEYTGSVKDKDGQPQKIGVQVVALGADEYRIVAYPGGLPGDGWDGKKEGRKIVTAKAEDGVLAATIDDHTGRLENGTITISHEEAGEVGVLEKVHRESPTLGARPPASAVVLYGGPADAAQWEGGKASDDGLLMPGAASKQEFGDHSLHLEFRLPYMPQARGQGRGNSGCYVQGRYEVQMLDSFGLDGKDNECGGIYKASEPAVNMCYPPLSWQTYDIDFTAPKYENGKLEKKVRITVRHNGVVIHDDLELPGATPGGRGGSKPESGPVFLQDHGNPVRYRNIWILEK